MCGVRAAGGVLARAVEGLPAASWHVGWKAASGVLARAVEGLLARDREADWERGFLSGRTEHSREGVSFLAGVTRGPRRIAGVRQTNEPSGGAG